MAKATKKYNHPETIYICMEQDGDDSYPISYQSIDGIDDKSVVGIYKLTGIKQLNVTSTLGDI